MRTVINNSQHTNQNSHFVLFGYIDPKTRTFALREEFLTNSSSISAARWRSEWEENFGNNSSEVQCCETLGQKYHQQCLPGTGFYGCTFYLRIPFSVTFVSVIAPVCLHFTGMLLLQSFFFNHLNTTVKLQHSLWTLICPPLFLDWELMYRENRFTVPIREGG